MIVRCGHIQTSVCVRPLCQSPPGLCVIICPGYTCALVLPASEGVSLYLPLGSSPRLAPPLCS